MALTLFTSLYSVDRKSIWRSGCLPESISWAACLCYSSFRGLIGAVFGFVGATFNYNYMRQEKSFMKQLLVSLGVSVFCYVAYFIFGICFNLLIRG